MYIGGKLVAVVGGAGFGSNGGDCPGGAELFIVVVPGLDVMGNATRWFSFLGAGFLSTFTSVANIGGSFQAFSWTPSKMKMGQTQNKWSFSMHSKFQKTWYL